MKFMIYAIFYLLYRLNLKARIDNINRRDHMIAKGKPVICEELTCKDVDMPLAVTIDCSAAAKRISKRPGVPETIDKIVHPIATILVKFLSVIVFVQKKLGGERII